MWLCVPSSPGVSMMLMLCSFHMVNVAADWMVMPRCLSSSMESMTAPTPSLPFTYKTKDTDGNVTPRSHERKSECLGFGKIPRAFVRFSRCRTTHVLSVSSSPSRCEPRYRCYEHVHQVPLPNTTSDKHSSTSETNKNFFILIDVVYLLRFYSCYLFIKIILIIFIY